MKLIFTFFIIVFSFFTFGQETKKVTVKNKENDTKEVFHVLVSNDTVKHGEYELFKGNKIRTKTSYSNNLIDGVWIAYYSNGEDVRLKENYVNGIKEGLSTAYNLEGEITEKGLFRRGVYFGEWEFLVDGKNLKYSFNGVLPLLFEDKKNDKTASSILSVKGNDTLEIKLDTPMLNTWTIKHYNEFISDNVRYPENAIENGLQGKVLIQFTIGENSVAKDFKVIKGISKCPECDQEALRVIKNIPQVWKAAISNGKPISGVHVTSIMYTMY